MDPLNVGVIGVGHLGSLHAKMYSQIASVKFVGVLSLKTIYFRCHGTPAPCILQGTVTPMMGFLVNPHRSVMKKQSLGAIGRVIELRSDMAGNNYLIAKHAKERQV